MSNGGIGMKGHDDGVRVKGERFVVTRKPARLPTPGMCFYHNQIPATYICNKCGRAICSKCAEAYGSLTFCPHCNPYPGGAPQPQQPTPKSRGLLNTGAGGSIMVGISAIFIGIFTFLAVISGELGGVTFFISAISILIFWIGCGGMSDGYYGFFKLYKSYFGIVAMIFGILSPIFFIICSVMAVNYDDNINEITLWIGHIFIGVMCILMGNSTLLTIKHTGKRVVCIAAGTLLIISGGMFIGLLGLVGVAWFLLAVGAFVQAAVFLTIPTISKLEENKKEISDHSTPPPPRRYY